MLDALMSLLGGFFGVLGNVLPASPFADWAQVTSDMSLGLGWLNWIVDVGGCLGILVAWIAVGVAVTLAKIAVISGKRMFNRLTNWNGGYTG